MFPVLARILTDPNMLGSKLGSLAIACALVDDVSAWCILGYIVLAVRAHHQGSGHLWVTLGGLAVFLLPMLYVVRPLLRPSIVLHDGGYGI